MNTKKKIYLTDQFPVVIDLNPSLFDWTVYLTYRVVTYLSHGPREDLMFNIYHSKKKNKLIVSLFAGEDPNEPTRWAGELLETNITNQEVYAAIRKVFSVFNSSVPKQIIYALPPEEL